MEIADSFNGYVKIADNSFVFHYSNQIVTLLPVNESKSEQIRISEKVSSETTDKPGFIYGEDGNSAIAFMKVSDFRRKLLTIDPTLWFSPPLIIKANGNAEGYFNSLTAEWDQFHAIAFCGGNINAIFDPQIALLDKDRKVAFSDDGSIEIKILPREKYTYTIKLNTGENIEMVLSVNPSGQFYDKVRKNAYSLGFLNSYIQFTFEKAQPPDVIEKYYSIARSLVAFLTMQNNVSFEMILRQRDRNNTFFDSALCKVYDGYENYSEKDRYRVIPISSINEQMPLLLEAIINHKFDTVLSLLPDNNKDIHKITITDVQNMCTALEVVYEWKKRDRKKDKQIEELKTQIKETIEDFKKGIPGIDPYMETTIRSSFQYLDFTLRNKIWTLYQENKIVVDIVSKKWSIPYLTEENIGKFVKLRNNKTHSGQFEWGDKADIYPVLFALVYCCSLGYIGVPETTIKDIILRLF